MSANLSAIISFLSQVGTLKRVKRTGWLLSGISSSQTESVADHCFRMSLMALSLGHLFPSIDLSRAITMSIVHDIAESIIGDITPGSPESVDKRARELAALQTLIIDLPLNLQQLIRDLFCEYEDQNTPTSRFCKAMDKLEMVLQAAEYENSQDLPLPQFFDSVKEHVKEWDDETISNVFDIIIKMRKF
ncbi:hypothetical protein P9112_012087 [Eukaryota sp. TZLM1-RC]